MENKRTFFWYDLETFGLNPSWDRIAQFAGQRTDMDLNPVGQPVILYCKLSADYLPDPAACLVTGITPQEVKEKGICESEFIEKINNEFSKPFTCTAGFNSIKFDDEFIRNALYRNFMDPYKREYENNCSRWDIIDLVRAAHDLRPEGITWPPRKENGNPEFKLTSLTKANNIDQTGAHDALVDVKATIEIARLIKKSSPKLFDFFFKLRKKQNVKEVMKLQYQCPILHTTSRFTTPNGCTRIVLPLTPLVNQNNSIVCFDLSQDVAPLLKADSENIFSTKGIFTIGINKSPFVSPVKTLKTKDAARLNIDKKLCLARAEEIKAHMPSVVLKIRKQDEQNDFEEIKDPDFQIYSGGFFRDSDQRTFKTIRETAPEQKLKTSFQFSDSRCQEMLWRHVCRSWPEVLTTDEMEKWKSFSAGRLLCPPGNIINSLDFVERKLVEKMGDNEIGPAQKSILIQLKSYTKQLKIFLELPEK